MAVSMRYAWFYASFRPTRAAAAASHAWLLDLPRRTSHLHYISIYFLFYFCSGCHFRYYMAGGGCVCVLVCLCKWARAKELPTFSLFCVRINGTCANAINWIKNQLKIVSSSSNNVREARTSRLCQVCVTRTIHKNGLNVFPDLIYSAVIDLIMEKLCPNTHHKRCQ